MKKVILIKLGELILKGLNRSYFEQTLIASLRYRLRNVGGYTLTSQQSAIYIVPTSDNFDFDSAVTLCCKTFGIVTLSVALEVPKNLPDIYEAAKTLNELNDVRTFKVESKRSDKNFPLKSPEISNEVGGEILEHFPHLSVDVHNPQAVVYVEVREQNAYIHAKPLKGAGGLPIGTSGKAVCLLSGGIDSPVAVWRMAKRGLSQVPVHFYSYPYTSEEAKQKVLKLAEILSSWTGSLPVHIVPFTKIQEEIRRKCPEDLFTLIMRRSMCRISERIALHNKCGAIITGESLGQVASQTMQAMAVTGEVTKLPIFRPLVGMDKEEVVKTAREIGTFETSILPYEDCCTVFTPKRPKTKPKLYELVNAEKEIDWQTLENEAFQNVEVIKF